MEPQQQAPVLPSPEVGLALPVRPHPDTDAGGTCSECISTGHSAKVQPTALLCLVMHLSINLPPLHARTVPDHSNIS